MNSKEYHVNKLVMKFISSCMKIRDSLLEMQQMFFSSFLVLFVLYFDCHMHAFAIMYNDAVMEIKQSFTITITTTTTTTTTTATTITITTTTTATTTTTTTTFVKRARPPGIVYYWILILKLKSKLILTAGRVMEEIQKENKNKVVNYICLIFWFATQTFKGGYKREMKFTTLFLLSFHIFPSLLLP